MTTQCAALQRQGPNVGEDPNPQCEETDVVALLGPQSVPVCSHHFKDFYIYGELLSVTGAKGNEAWPNWPDQPEE